MCFLTVKGITGTDGGAGGGRAVLGTLMAEMGGKLEAETKVGAFVNVGVGGSSMDGISLLGGMGMLGLRRVGGLAGRSKVTDALEEDDLDELTRRMADGSALATMDVV